MKKNKNLTTGIVIVVIIIILTIAAALYQQNTTSNTSELVLNNSDLTHTNPSSYESGKYEAIGRYISPGGAEEIGVTLVLEDSIIVDSEVKVLATRDISLKIQEDFAENHKRFVVGKDINDVKLTKVSGSSLTPNGFNDAVERIKAQAGS